MLLLTARGEGQAPVFNRPDSPLDQQFNDLMTIMTWTDEK